MAEAMTTPAHIQARLAGFRVGVLAHRGSQEQADALRRAGAEPVLGAVVGPVAPAAIEALEVLTEDLIDRPPSGVVLTTPAGVEGWMSTAEGAERDEALRALFAGATVVVTGQGTGEVAATLGIAVAGTLEVGGSQGRDRLARLTGGLAGSRVAIQTEIRPAPDFLAAPPNPGGPAGTDDGGAGNSLVGNDQDGGGLDLGGLRSSLVEAGAEVVEVAVPRPAPAVDPPMARRLVQAVAEHRVDALTFTTPAEVHGFVGLAVEAGLWDNALAALGSEVVPLCLAPSSAVAAGTVGVTGIVQPDRPRVGSMVERLEERLGLDIARLVLAGTDVVLQGALAVVDGEAVWLADRERSLLEALAHRSGTVVAKAELLRRVWRSDGTDGADGHAVEVAVARLRHRLGPAGAALQTVPRRGYCLVVG